MVQLNSDCRTNEKHFALSVTWTIFLLMIVVASAVQAQDCVDSSSILDRFSISLSASYHYAPWKDLNVDHNSVRDAVESNPQLRNPSGSAENIYGDDQIDGAVGLEIVRGLSLEISGAYLPNSSDLNLRQVPDPANTSTLHTAFSLKTFMIGAGLQYEHPLTSVLSAMVSVSAYRAFGKMHFDYNLTQWDVLRTAADLSSSAWAGVVRCGMKLELVPGLSMIGSINYRLLAFREFAGTGRRGSALSSQPTNLSGWEYGYDAHLVAEEGSFGVLLKSTNGYEEYFPDYGWNQNYHEVPTRNAVLNLSGFGGEIGIEFRP